MYYFISGYTARVGGHRSRRKRAKNLPFRLVSARLSFPYIQLKYADLLGKKLRKSKAKVWLINTGWVGGPYGVGSRIKLPYTRAMITAALNGDLDKVAFEKHPVFGMEIPTTCPGRSERYPEPEPHVDGSGQLRCQSKIAGKRVYPEF